MKKKLCIMLLLSLFMLQSACSGQSQPTASLSPTPVQTAKATTSPVPTAAQTATKAYAKVYYDVVANLIRQYGFNNLNTGCFSGFLRGDLIDFDNDGEPELACVYQKGGTEFDRENVCIYRFSEDTAKLLVEKQMGEYVWLGGPPSVRYSYIDGKTYIIAEDDIKGKLERLYIYTVEKGALHTINLSAKPTPKKGGEYEVDHYLNSEIDGKSVSEEEYRAQRDYYFKNTIEWNELEDDNGKSITTKEYAAKFVKSLAVDAGVSENEVNILLQSTPTTSPVTSTPRATSAAAPAVSPIPTKASNQTTTP